jgi:hypothetical protein
MPTNFIKKTTMKKLIFVLSVLLLTGCSGNNQDVKTPPVAEVPSTWYAQNFGDFTIQIPPNWAKDSTAQEGMVVYKSLPENDFVKNMNIIKLALDEQQTSKEYAQKNIESIIEAFLEYKEIAVGEVDINGIITLLHKFQARNNEADNFAHFTQGYFAKDNAGYIITCVVSESSPEIDRKTCSQAVESFQFN